MCPANQTQCPCGECRDMGLYVAAYITSPRSYLREAKAILHAPAPGAPQWRPLLHGRMRGILAPLHASDPGNPPKCGETCVERSGHGQDHATTRSLQREEQNKQMFINYRPLSHIFDCNNTELVLRYFYVVLLVTDLTGLEKISQHLMLVLWVGGKFYSAPMVLQLMLCLYFKPLWSESDWMCDLLRPTEAQAGQEPSLGAGLATAGKAIVKPRFSTYSDNNLALEIELYIDDARLLRQ